MQVAIIEKSLIFFKEKIEKSIFKSISFKRTFFINSNISYYSLS